MQIRFHCTSPWLETWRSVGQTQSNSRNTLMRLCCIAPTLTIREVSRGVFLIISVSNCCSLQKNIVKGCPCTLEESVFAHEENLPYEHVAGHPLHLKYMSLSLHFRAEVAALSLSIDYWPKDLSPVLDTCVFFRYDQLLGIYEHR